jgi:hypothetical protein
MLNCMILPERIIILTQDSTLSCPSFLIRRIFKEPINDGYIGRNIRNYINNTYWWVKTA